MHRYLGVVLCTLVYVQAAVAQDTEFSRCLSELKHTAKQQQLPAQIIDEVLAKLQPQPRVIELDRAQPEFTQTFAAYVNHRVTPRRVTRGRDLLEQHHQLLSRLYDTYGVSGHYLVAFWGLETNYGSYLGRMPILDCLATLACDQRRSAFFTDELMQALLLLDRESLSTDEMRGSWAGAMGHTQFMPSAYNRYAIDADGDGKVNLWRSVQDALASAANYLHELGMDLVSGPRMERLSMIFRRRRPCWYLQATLDRRSWCFRILKSLCVGIAVKIMRWQLVGWQIGSSVPVRWLVSHQPARQC